jgi:hypothetical protein
MSPSKHDLFPEADTAFSNPDSTAGPHRWQRADPAQQLAKIGFRTLAENAPDMRTNGMDAAAYRYSGLGNTATVTQNVEHELLRRG